MVQHSDKKRSRQKK